MGRRLLFLPGEVCWYATGKRDEFPTVVTREIYLVKYTEPEAASIIFSIDVKLRIAEVNSKYKGFEADVIVKKLSKTHDQPPELEFREGAFVLGEERKNLVGGWAKVSRKDFEKPFYIAVSLSECQKFTRDGNLTRFWKESPADQIRKVALSRAFTEAFPNRFAGTSTDVEAFAAPGVIPEKGQMVESFTTAEGYPDWAHFWAKQKEKFPKNFNIESTVHQILGVESIKAQWTDLGRTLEEADAVINDYLANRNKPKGQLIEGESRELPAVPAAGTKPVPGKDERTAGFIRVESNCHVCGTKVTTDNEADTICPGCGLTVQGQGSNPSSEPRIWACI